MTTSAVPTAQTTPRLRRMRYEPEPGARSEPPPPLRILPTPTPPVETPVEDVALRRTLAGLVRVALEVLDGRRPLAHIAGHFGASALRCWQVAAAQRRVRKPARIERMVLCVPRTGAAEVAAVCAIDGRVRALAARFERTGPDGRWRCVAVRLG